MADDYTYTPGAGYSSDLHKNIISEADTKAKNAYNASMLALEGEKVALQKAQQAWKETTDKAGLTGMFEGQWTMPVQQWQAETFGTWGAPSAGQQTLTAQQQYYKQAYDLATQYGQYYAPGTTPTSGMQTQAAQAQQFAQQQALAAMYGTSFAPGQQAATGQMTQAAQEQAYTQWLRAQQEQRAQETANQQTAQNYLTLLSNLRGPADWAKYQEVLGATPGGMRDVVSAAMGNYIPGGGATTGQTPQAANLNTLYQQVSGNGTNTMGAQPQQYNLPAPNQIAAQSWKNLPESTKQMMLGQYESQGWYKPDVENLFNQSLPKYASNAPTAGTFRLNQT